MAIELAPYEININAICPGSVDTPMMELFAKAAGMSREEMISAYSGAHLFPRLVSAEGIANAVTFLASDEAKYITGAVLPVDAGWFQKSAV